MSADAPLHSTAIREPCRMCDDVRLPLVAISLALFVLRRLRPTAVALIAYRTWRRLPPEQRQQIILAARRNGPRLASSLARRSRSPL